MHRRLLALIATWFEKHDDPPRSLRERGTYYRNKKG